MRLTHFFIDRPRFATVLGIFVTLFGLGALTILPVAQYPEIVPPTVKVTASYPGASAETVASTVATPLEQEINGVENMLYMSSQSTGDGNLTITVTFRIGTDLNVAQMLTQNRVQDALSRLPEDVQRLGVQVRKATPSILMAVHLYSPDESRDTLYLSNYATLHVKDVLARLQGVGDVQFQGARQYAMRIWLDPDKVAAYNLSANEVLSALRAQNLQVSAGILNQPPAPSDEAYQINVEALGRLSTPEQFADIVLKSDSRGRVTRVRDVGRVEVGAADYGSTARCQSNDHLRPEYLHCQVDQRGCRHDFCCDPPRRRGGIPVSAELARDDEEDRDKNRDDNLLDRLGNEDIRVVDDCRVDVWRKMFL